MTTWVVCDPPVSERVPLSVCSVNDTVGVAPATSSTVAQNTNTRPNARTGYTRSASIWTSTFCHGSHCAERLASRENSARR